MVLYEVNLRVDAGIAEEFDAWLTPHVAEMLTFPGFEKARRWVRLDPPEAEAPSVWWTVHYEVDSMASLQAYFDGPAARMRGDGLTRFGGRFDATRRILECTGGD